MPLTDVQIYEAHPDVKALNDEYVALGKQLPELANAVSAAGAKLADAEAHEREVVRVATEQVQSAQKALAKVKAEQRLAVVTAHRGYDEAEGAQKSAKARRAEVQRLHNEAIDAIQAAQGEEEPTPQE